MLSFIAWMAVAVGVFISTACFYFVYEDWRNDRD